MYRDIVPGGDLFLPVPRRRNIGMGSWEYTEDFPIFPKAFPLGIGLGDMADQHLASGLVLFQFQGYMGAPRPIIHHVDQNAKGVLAKELPDFFVAFIAVVGR